MLTRQEPPTVAPAGPGPARCAPVATPAPAAQPQDRPLAVTPPADALAATLARAVGHRASRAPGLKPSRPTLQRVARWDGTVAGAAAHYVEMTGMEIATGDNLHSPNASIYTRGMSGCASLITRRGTTLRLAHSISVGFPTTAATQAAIENTWLQSVPPPDEVILAFGTDYPNAASSHGSHLIEEMLANSGYAGTVTRYYNANSVVVDTAGTVTVNPPGFVHNAPATSNCCVIV